MTHPQSVKHVYKAFLDSGADVIIANTYATNQHIMDAADLGDQFQRANRIAVQLAHEARDEWAAEHASDLSSGRRMLPVIAGSVSCHAPGNEVDKMNGQVPWPAASTEAKNYRDQAVLLVEAGVDLIFTEMIWNQEHGQRLVASLADLPVPIFVGITCFSDNAILSRSDVRVGQKLDKFEAGSFQETVESENTEDWPIQTAVKDLLGANPHIVGFNIHHTKLENTLPALKAVREAGWEGPLGSYPDYGVWNRTGWSTPVPLDGQILVELAELWQRETGCLMVGGCCGIGHEHIRALRSWSDDQSKSIVRSVNARSKSHARRSIFQSYAANSETELK